MTTTFQTIETNHLRLVVGGQAAPQQKQPPGQPQAQGAQPDTSAQMAGSFDFNTILAAIQQGLGGLQSIVGGIQQIAQLFQQFMPQQGGTMTAQGSQAGGADQQAA